MPPRKRRHFTAEQKATVVEIVKMSGKPLGKPNQTSLNELEPARTWKFTVSSSAYISRESHKL
jgi:hypothetical protein